MGSPFHSPPAPPSPSQDPGLIPHISPTSPLVTAGPAAPHDSLAWNADTITPLRALMMLANIMHVLVETTGDVPSTPPALPLRAPTPRAKPTTADQRPSLHRRTSSRPGTPVPSHDLESPRFRKLSVGTPESDPDEPRQPDDYLTAGDRAAAAQAAQAAADEDADAALQSAFIARKFFCKQPAEVPIAAYLARLHRYCPMSAGVYLAAGAYIHRLCLLPPPSSSSSSSSPSSPTHRLRAGAVPATRRTAHRLALAALRVAHKALEDLRYPQQRFALVGGVTPAELAQLEICLCYLLDFELQAGVPVLQAHWRGLARAVAGGVLGPGAGGARPFGHDVGGGAGAGAGAAGMGKENLMVRLPLRLRVGMPS
jgi:hypothetical protein